MITVSKLSTGKATVSDGTTTFHGIENIKTDNEKNVLSFYTANGGIVSVDFSDISDTHETADAKALGDYYLTNGFLLSASAGGGGGGGDLSVLEASNAAIEIATESADTKLSGLATVATNTGNTATSAASIDTKSTAISTNTGNTASSVSSIDTKSTTIATNTGNTATNTATIAGAVVSDGGHIAMRVAIDEDYTTLSNQLSVADTNIKLSLKQTHDNLPLFYDRVNGGAGAQTYSATLCNTAMAVTSGTDYAIAQTFMRPNYTASTTHCIEFTMSNFQVQTNVRKRVGLFNGGTVAPYNTLDGVYIESDGTDGKYYACYANAGTVERVELTSLAPYGVTVDWSKHQAVVLRYLYLGGTAIQYSVMIGARAFRIAEIQLSNVITSPFILRPNQPVRYEIRSAGGAGTLNQTCAAVYKLGDGTVEGVTRAVLHPGGINYASAGTEYALFAFRKKSTHLSVEVQLSEFDIAVSAAETFQYQLLINPTITNAPAYTGVANSSVEYFTGAANTTVTGGTVLAAGTATELANNNSIFPSNITIGHNIAGVSDVFVISLIPRAGGISPFASCGWHEGI